MTRITLIKEELEKVLHAIQQDRTPLCNLHYPKSTGFDDTRITVENLADLAGNHLFDDESQWFGITKLEGHKIRRYFQECCNYDYILELHETFPTIIEQEREDYLDWVNHYREKAGLKPIYIKTDN